MNPLRLTKRLLLPACAALGLAGCGGVKLWPFGTEEGRVVVPQNATQYRCDANRGFYLRFLATGEAWVILPAREFRLDRVASVPGRRFSNGSAVLDLGAQPNAEATLNDGPSITFSGCKAAS